MGGCTAMNAIGVTWRSSLLRVLHHWDFNSQPVSAMAADYLASICDRPLLCIGAVNPGRALPSPT